MAANRVLCPSCAAEIPSVEGWVTWCEVCGWNLKAPETGERETRFGRAAQAAGRRLGERLATELAAEVKLEPRITTAKATGYAVAVLVHVLTLLLAGVGVLLIVLPFPHIFGIFAGLVMIGLAYLMRPRIGAAPTEGLLTVSDAPTLHALVERAAGLVGTTAPDLIRVDGAVNASWSTYGLRRRTVLTLGIPLLARLEPQERVALIAHELAHARNGDATRGVIVGSAIGALSELYLTIAPAPDLGDAELGFGDLLAKPILWLLSRPVLGLLLLELHLFYRDSQRAEYLADAVAARIAGTTATISMHESLLHESSSTSAIQQLALGRAEPHELFASISAAARNVPDRERERRRRVARLEGARLDVTHPPSGMRIRLLEVRPHLEPALQLGNQDAAAIDDELHSSSVTIARHLAEEYRESLYA